MGWGMSMLGYAALKKSFEGMIPGLTDTWMIGPETDYDVYIEYGTAWNLFTRKPMPPRPYVRPGSNRAMAMIAVLEHQAKDINALLRLLALRMEYEMKAVVKEKEIWDTGNLWRSIQAVKQ